MSHAANEHMLHIQRLKHIGCSQDVLLYSFQNYT